MNSARCSTVSRAVRNSSADEAKLGGLIADFVMYAMLRTFAAMGLAFAILMISKYYGVVEIRLRGKETSATTNPSLARTVDMETQTGRLSNLFNVIDIEEFPVKSLSKLAAHMGLPLCRRLSKHELADALTVHGRQHGFEIAILLNNPDETPMALYTRDVIDMSTVEAVVASETFPAEYASPQEASSESEPYDHSDLCEHCGIRQTFEGTDPLCLTCYQEH